MAEFVLNNASVVVNSVDLSAYVTSVTLSQSAETVEDTSMGDTARTYVAGLKTGTIDLEFNADFAAAKTEATVFPLVGTATQVVIKADSGSTSATNPQYTATAIVTEWPSISGSVGELATHNCSWPIAGTVAKATS